MPTLTKEKTKLKFKQPRAAKNWAKVCDVIVVEREDGLFYAAIAKAPAGGCGLDRETLNVATPAIALQHITDWANAHETRIASVQEGEEKSS